MRNHLKRHRLFSLLLAIPILWFSITGLLLSLMDLKIENSYPHALSNSVAEGCRPNLEQILAFISSRSIRENKPQVQRIFLPITCRQSLQIRYNKGEVEFFDPTTLQGIPLRGTELGFEAAKSFLVKVHRGKFFGILLRIFFSIIALSLISVVYTGILTSFKVASRSRLRRLHRLIGVTVGAPFLFLICSGAVLNLSNELRPNRPAVSSHLADINKTLPLLAAKTVGQSSQLEEIVILKNEVLLYFHDTSRSYWKWDDEKADFLLTKSYLPWTAQGWLEPIYNLHAGRWAEPWSILFDFVVAVGVVFLVFSGLKIRFGKVKIKPSSAQAK